MSTTAARVRQDALALSVAERADLAFALLQSLRPPGVADAASSEFEGELDRRAAAYEAGEIPAKEWETVSARLQRDLEKRNRP